MAGRKPGSAKTGGRKKGTPNKETMSLFKRCERMEADPFKAMIKFVKDETSKYHYEACKELLPYLYPKRSAISVDIDPELAQSAEEILKATKEDKIAILEAELKELKS